jgi:ABC-type proline/glycine betaine transport system ATPase subunit
MTHFFVVLEFSELETVGKVMVKSYELQELNDKFLKVTELTDGTFVFETFFLFPWKCLFTSVLPR